MADICRYLASSLSLDFPLTSYYTDRRTAVGNERFCYHGTKIKCGLGKTTAQPCKSTTTCSACSILKSSFKVSEAKGTGAYVSLPRNSQGCAKADLALNRHRFGKGIYTSSSSNKAYRQYCGISGALFVCKVALGKVKTVNRFKEVTGCPPGYNSVSTLRLQGNETRTYFACCLVGRI